MLHSILTTSFWSVSVYSSAIAAVLAARSAPIDTSAASVSRPRSLTGQMILSSTSSQQSGSSVGQMSGDHHPTDSISHAQHQTALVDIEGACSSVRRYHFDCHLAVAALVEISRLPMFRIRAECTVALLMAV